MMKRQMSILALLCFSNLLCACTSPGASKRKLGLAPETFERLVHEPPVQNTDSIAERAAKTFSEAEGLSPEQRKKLHEIYLDTFAQASKIRAEIGKAKSLLFKLVSSSAYESKAVETLIDHITDLDQKRLMVMFQALSRVQNVVGYGPDKHKLYKHFYDFEYPRHHNLSENNDLSSSSQ